MLLFEMCARPAFFYALPALAPYFCSMTFEEFKTSLSDAAPPAVSAHLKALWFDARGDWEGSHDIVQEITDNNASWIHAYLHRKEGDNWNADYWYQRAGKKRPNIPLQEEWEVIAKALTG